MSPMDLSRVKKAACDVLYDAREPIQGREFLKKLVENGYTQEEVISAVRQMLDGGDVVFDAEMNLRLARQMA